MSTSVIWIPSFQPLIKQRSARLSRLVVGEEAGLGHQVQISVSPPPLNRSTGRCVVPFGLYQDRVCDAIPRTTVLLGVHELDDCGLIYPLLSDEVHSLQMFNVINIVFVAMWADHGVMFWRNE
jgi:hypothetical protein